MTITKQVTTILLMSNMSICSIDETIEDSTEEASNTVQDFLDRIDEGMDTVTDESDAWRELTIPKTYYPSGSTSLSAEQSFCRLLFANLGSNCSPLI